MTEIRLCRDCRHAEQRANWGGSGWVCWKNGRTSLDLVTGEQRQADPPGCYRQRENTPAGWLAEPFCGPEGKFWEAK